jgi:hypothetical protein
MPLLINLYKCYLYVRPFKVHHEVDMPLLIYCTVLRFPVFSSSKTRFSFSNAVYLWKEENV